ncbi:hypothetical protein SAMN05216352_12426 [Alteribacillus bidgolensis]|uniref:Uncharacterized protein n=1 Tax=Alteribacillus bidgolensis TaxID=930129 RepID=A0A1G8R3H7_9BACI|nr:hypothetical protein SAMN05216352_12426 [Alteribacillus bidgolensis]
MKVLENKKIICLLSLISIIVGTSVTRNDDVSPWVYLGFPAEWIQYNSTFGFNVNLLGLTFNFVFFYFIFLMIEKLLNKTLYHSN